MLIQVVALSVNVLSLLVCPAFDVCGLDNKRMWILCSNLCVCGCAYAHVSVSCHITMQAANITPEKYLDDLTSLLGQSGCIRSSHDVDKIIS